MQVLANAIMVAEIALSLAWLWLMVRRFHDQDRPGWAALFPTALAILAVIGVPLDAALLASVCLGFLIVLFLPGTIGPNRYGPDPRGWKSREHFLEQQRALNRR
jgi:uncharacterized membrane protein YhaH (DUF805 family)